MRTPAGKQVFNRLWQFLVIMADNPDLSAKLANF